MTKTKEYMMRKSIVVICLALGAAFYACSPDDRDHTQKKTSSVKAAAQDDSQDDSSAVCYLTRDAQENVTGAKVEARGGSVIYVVDNLSSEFQGVAREQRLGVDFDFSIQKATSGADGQECVVAQAEVYPVASTSDLPRAPHNS